MSRALLIAQLVCIGVCVNVRVTACMEHLEMSGNLTAVREMSGILLKIREMSGKKSGQGKIFITVYCKMHICIHTGIYY